MSGPALRTVKSHQAIHETAWNEADEVLRLAKTLRASSDDVRFLQVVEVFLEIVEARILAHAAEEEHGLYREWLRANGQNQPLIDSLVVEHEALRGLAQAMEQAMVRQQYETVVSTMSELLQVSVAHSQHEEKILGTIALAGEASL